MDKFHDAYQLCTHYSDVGLFGLCYSSESMNNQKGYIASHFGTLTNSADPDQMPQNAVSDQGLHRLLIEISIKNMKVHQTPLKTEMDCSN